MIRTNIKLGRIKERLVFERALKASCLTLAVFLLTFVFAPYLALRASALTTTATTDVSWGTVSLALDPDSEDVATVGQDGHGNIDFGEVAPSAKSGDNKGTMVVLKKNLKVTTSGKSYSVFLSVGSNSVNDLILNGTDSSKKIEAIGGTWDAPVAFSRGGWGFAVPDTNIATSPSTWADADTAEYPTFAGAGGDNPADTFGANATTLAKLGTQLTSNDSSYYNQNTWAAVPLKGAEQQIYRNTENGGFASGDDFDVYYAVMVDEEILAGAYSNTVVYTALASSDSLDTASKNITRSEQYAYNGASETISFDMTLSTGSALLTATNTHVYLVPHTTVEAANYVVTPAMKAAIVTGSQNPYAECAFSDANIVTSGVGVTITCTMPDLEPLGNNDGKGLYDFWVHLDDYNIDYISKYYKAGSNDNTVVASVWYVGLQSRDSSGYIVKNMQDMSSSICKNTNKWGTAYGSAARVYDYNGLTQVVDDSTITSAGAYASLDIAKVAANTALGVGTFELTDTRDSKTYLIRRLADGNCWMVQNLDLDLAAAANGTITLNDTNTDLHTKTSWVPGSAQLAEATELATAGTIPSATIADYTNYYLGTSQSTLFQSGSQNGASWHWGSKYAETVSYDSGTSTWVYTLGNHHTPGTLLATSNLSDLEDTNNSATAWAWMPKNRSYMATKNSDGSYTNRGRNGTATTQSGNSSVENPTSVGQTWVENNSLAEMPRSYDTGLTNWINNSNPNANGTGSHYSVAFSQSSDTNVSDLINTSAADYSANPTYKATGDNAKTSMVGDWYNWYAATAESGTWDMVTDSVAGSAQDSICPKGWRLPYNANVSGSWVNLLTSTYQANNTATVSAINSTAGSQMLRNAPLSIVFSGDYYWVYGGLNNRGYNGYYWSSTPYAATYARYLYFYSTYVNPQGGGNKTYGLTIRCVAW